MKNDVKEKKEENLEELEKKLNKKKINEKRYKILLITIIVLLVIIIIVIWSLTFRIGRIGYEYLTAWESHSINLTEKDLQIVKDTELNIFNFKTTDGRKVIAPGQKGEYNFTIKNDSGYNMIYNIKFCEEMTKELDIKYKLKIDNIYIRGNENEYVEADKLEVDDIIIPKNSKNIYTLEWCMGENEKEDTLMGISADDIYYYFRIEINSNIYDKKE